MDAMIDEMATKYKDDKKLDLDTAKAQLMEKMTGADSKMHGTTVCPTVTVCSSNCFSFAFYTFADERRSCFSCVCFRGVAKNLFCGEV